MTPNAWIRIVGCCCICILETAAIIKGVNGATFGIAIAAIGGIVGSTSPIIANLFKSKNHDK
ncbi:unnamed protein product [marine sediment metagenome]|uniref:Uncharacterized protein n=1 Tax=marine sediment metagenome TaxID=412755 RepID=X1JVY6_9ZZZZ